MSGHFSPGDKQRSPLYNEKGNTTRLLLLVLLLVVAAAGYLYYFTDVIKPKQEPVKPPVEQPAQVKQPIPPRPGQPGAKEAAPAPAQPEQKPVAVPPAKPEPVKTAQAEAPAKPAPPPAAAPKPAAQAPTSTQKPVSPAPAAAPKPAAKPAAKPATPAPTAPTAPTAKKEPAPVKTAQKAAKPVEKKKGGPYRLLIGDYVPDQTFKAVQAKLKKSGIAPVRKSEIKAVEPMNRLYVAEYADQTMAEVELQMVRKLTADAFLVPEKDKYFLYAGSYFSSSRAASEQGKLKAKGVKTVIRKAEVPIKVTRVTAGSYASQEDAREDVARLKKHGIKASVIKATK